MRWREVELLELLEAGDEPQPRALIIGDLGARPELLKPQRVTSGQPGTDEEIAAAALGLDLAVPLLGHRHEHVRRSRRDIAHPLGTEIPQTHAVVFVKEACAKTLYADPRQFHREADIFGARQGIVPQLDVVQVFRKRNGTYAVWSARVFLLFEHRALIVVESRKRHVDPARALLAREDVAAGVLVAVLRGVEVGIIFEQRREEIGEA